MNDKAVKSGGAFSSPTIATAKRALSFGKTYIALAVFLSVIAIGINYGVTNTHSTNHMNITANLSNASASAVNVVSKLASAHSGVALIEVPLGVEAAVMLVTPIVILFVYDKNEGVLEYLLSLGMTQRDIYKRYLKAALLITVLYLIAFILANLVYSYMVFGMNALTVTYTILFLVTVLAMSVVAFIITAMMVFSSLQKSRAGDNQPLAISIGMAVGALPEFLLTFMFPFDNVATAEIVQAAIIAVASLTLFMLSDRLIKREKFLP